jgi:hypothetical protein
MFLEDLMNAAKTGNLMPDADRFFVSAQYLADKTW